MGQADRARYRENLQGEVDSATLYRALATMEANPKLAEVYSRLAAIEEKHAAMWRTRLGASGAFAKPVRVGFRTRALIWLARRFGAALVLPVIHTLEQVDSGTYDDQPEAVAAGLPAMERSHARILGAIAGERTQGLAGSALAQIEGRHRGASGNALRAAVLGANDGLVSNLSLVMGVAGAAMPSRTVLVTGLAGLLAGACSMAMGEWLSVNSSREFNQRQIDAEARELREVPDEEREELALIYEAKGLAPEEARALAERLMANEETALDTLSREELGIDPQELGGSAWTAAGSSFLLFSAGAIFPVAPYFLFGGMEAVWASIGLSSLALFAIGIATSLFTGRGAIFSGTRQLVVGLAAAGVTFAVGRIIGVAVTG
ncbi:MAG TPA: VIT1/CCC1 family protein [Alphaproteobacteria bacterium]|nr:VIT1/CCC1 family protein [Alphaproteobacteria bacterium]